MKEKQTKSKINGLEMRSQNLGVLLNKQGDLNNKTSLGLIQRRCWAHESHGLPGQRIDRAGESRTV